jgi:extradiol dioxygenase family protein
MSNNFPPFHLAFPVRNLLETKLFYTNFLGCTIGRSSNEWIDFNFYGHQITAHLSPDSCDIVYNKVDDKSVPVRHFGLIMDWEDWHKAKDKLINNKAQFIIEPYIRFKNKPGEQATLFIVDPSINGIELKSFKDKSMIFAT